MGEFTPEVAGSVQRLVAFDIFRGQIANGHLTKEGLLTVRARLDSGEFEPGPDRELLQLEVDDAVAAAYGVSPDDLPGRTPVEDYPPDEDQPGDAA